MLPRLGDDRSDPAACQMRCEGVNATLVPDQLPPCPLRSNRLQELKRAPFERGVQVVDRSELLGTDVRELVGSG